MSSSLAERKRIVMMVVGAATALSLGGLSSTWWLKSPQELVAQAEPPDRSVLTAVVEKRVLRDTVILRGDVGAGGTFDLTPSLRDGGRPIVTAIRIQPGDRVEEGVVLLEVAGRPLAMLKGDIPAYRDLRPGMDGKDIAQLQVALKSLGFNPIESNGYFGSGTKSAVAAYYRKLGYDPATTGQADELALSSARSSVKAAERALAEAKTELSGSASPSSDTQNRVKYAEEDLADARKALADLDRRTGVMLPMSEYAFLPTFPARVDALKAILGADVAAPLLTVSSGGMRVNATVNQAQRLLLKTGMNVEYVSETMGISGQGTIESIGDLANTKGFPIVVIPAGAVNDKLIGQNVRLTVEAARSDGDVLVVPISSLYSGADGSPAVLKQLTDGSQERVLVTAGVSGDGFVSVTPVTAGQLVAGDKVTIGRS